MTRRKTVYAGLVLPVLTLLSGIALGRVIEAAALAVVLFAIWTWVQRTVVAPDDQLPGRRGDPWT